MKPVILFDGLCNMCSTAMRFVIAHSAPDQWRFIPLQSEEGHRLARQLDIDPDDPTSLAVIDGPLTYTQSDAVLAIAAKLHTPWSRLKTLQAIPKSWRDAAYRLLARHRYRIAGRRTCPWQPGE